MNTLIIFLQQLNSYIKIESDYSSLDYLDQISMMGSETSALDIF